MLRVGIVTNREIKKNRDAEKDSRLMQAEVSEAEDVQTVELISQCGEQYNPPDGSVLYILDVGAAWKLAVASCDEVAPDDTLEQGERKLYALDGDNNVIAWIYLRSDGAIRLANDSGSLELSTDGVISAGSGADYVALAAKVDALFKQITDLLAGAGLPPLWVPAPMDGGLALQMAAKSLWVTPGPIESVASTNLKADEE